MSIPVHLPNVVELTIALLQTVEKSHQPGEWDITSDGPPISLEPHMHIVRNPLCKCEKWCSEENRAKTNKLLNKAAELASYGETIDLDDLSDFLIPE